MQGTNLDHSLRTTLLGTLLRTGIKVGVMGTISSRKSIGITEYLNKHTARGSSYTGSWRDISSYYVKSLSLRSSAAGTLVVSSAMVGTATDQGTFSVNRYGPGSYSVKTWSDNTRFAKARWINSGSTTSGKGTLNLTWGLQV